MGKNEFDLDLRLYPSSSSSSPPRHYRSHLRSEPQWRQHITIFNNRCISVCDLTEIQARAILWLASREVEERINNNNNNSKRIINSPAPSSEMISAASMRSLRDVYFIPGLSMKRSLERFFQKRRHRIQSASPYDH